MIKRFIPHSVKQALKKLPIRFTKNQRYDHWTEKIISTQLKAHSNCIDVGCFEGEILDLILKASPKGKHFAYEPIPVKYKDLDLKYRKMGSVQIFNLALSNEVGHTSFNYVESNPPYSGIKKRIYDQPNEKDSLIQVELSTLDQTIPKDVKIDLIKIDVEGAEFLVLQGGKELISRDKPLVIFEHGLGASDVYGTEPKDVYRYFEDCGMRIYLLDGFLKNKSALSLPEFENNYFKRLNYAFVAAGA